MTFLEMQDQVLGWLDELDDTDVTRTVVKNALNAVNRQRALERDWRFMLKQPPVYTTWVPGQQAYELPEDFRRIFRLYNVTRDFDYREIPEDNLAQRLPSPRNTERTSFYIRGGNDPAIILFAPPEADEVELHYYRRPSKLVDDGDLPDLPEDYADLLVWDALILLKGYHNDPAALAVWAAQQSAVHDALLWEYGTGSHSPAGETFSFHYIP